MGWLIYQTWLLLLIAFILGCMTAWLATTLFVPDLPDTPPPQADASASSEGEAKR